WRRMRALSSRAFCARLARARRAEKQAWEAADGFAQALLFRYHRALESGARIPDRQSGRRPRAARQRLSLRHGHARGRVAGSRPADFSRRAVGHSRRTGSGVARRGRRQDAGVCLTRWELALWTREQRERRKMSRQVARTPGAKRAGDGEYVFDLAAVNHILGGPDYSTANGACVEGDRMIVALMRMPAGTGAEPHSHPNEQWIYILQGTFRAKIGEKEIEAKPGSVVYVPSNVVHSGEATPEGDVVFFTCKDASHSLHGVKA